MDEIIILDEENARVQARRHALGLEVVTELFGEDAVVDEKAQEIVVKLGEITERLGFTLVSYKKGA